MTTLNAEPVAFDTAAHAEDAGPVRLCPWLENPYRLVSLWEIMITLLAEKLYWSGLAIQSLQADCFLDTGIGELPLPIAYHKGPLKQKTRDKAIYWLKDVEEVFSSLGMVISGATVSEIMKMLQDESRGLSSEWLKDRLTSLQDLTRKEMSSKVFFYVTPEKLRFHPTTRKQHIFGDKVAQAFPSAAFDISESGVCLALSRATACVFHLMRVLEIGLTAFGAKFGESLAHTNWAPAIEKIESKVRDMHKDPVWKGTPDCKEQQEFYAQAASHFGILKDAWRNYTAHARGINTEEKAALIFDNVREFMQTLATRLHE